MIELAPSILSADFAHLAEQVRRATEGGGTVVHVDIMDGHFVPNLTIGPPVVKSLRKATELPLDCHLMIETPTSSSPSLSSQERTGCRFIRKSVATWTAPCT